MATVTKFESLRELQRIAVGDSYLTPREYQVVAMYIDGHRQSVMPGLLACCVQTINRHLRSAKDRTGAKTLYELVAMVAAADAIRGRGRSSNQESNGRIWSMPSTVVDLPGTAPSRAL